MNIPNSPFAVVYHILQPPGDKTGMLRPGIPPIHNSSIALPDDVPSSDRIDVIDIRILRPLVYCLALTRRSFLDAEASTEKIA